MSSVRTLYNQWSATYDAVENKTRDLEKMAGLAVLASIPVTHIIELGCGTGKNTEWLSTRANRVTAVDMSEEMMAIARKKVNNNTVTFHLADITIPWNFVAQPADLITCSLIL